MSAPAAAPAAAGAGDVAVDDATTGTDSGATSGAESAPEVPTLLRVERGDPTPHELAALTLVIAALAGGGGDAPPASPSRHAWGSRWRTLHPRSSRGPGWGGW